MGRTPMSPESVRSRPVGVRLTPAEYKWIEAEAKRQSAQLGVKVSMSAITLKLLRQAMARA